MTKDQMLALAKIKPCPFCGGWARIASYVSCDCCGKAYNGQVRCQSCAAALDHFDTDGEAVAAWNTRATDQEISNAE